METAKPPLGIANIAVSDEKPDVIIIPAESLIGPDDPESKGYMSYAANFGKSLANVGIPYRTACASRPKSCCWSLR